MGLLSALRRKSVPMVTRETPPDQRPARYRMDCQIQMVDIWKTFGQQTVLKGVNLDVERGKINIILGGSGQGKSVITKLIMGLLKPDKGEILVDGVDLVPFDEFQLNEVRKKFGMIYQYSALWDSMTVMENVAFPLAEHTKLPRAEIERRVREKLALVNLPGIEHKYPAELSGGMRKRVSLARGIMLEPEILVYDEPTTGLDPIATKNADDLIAEMSHKLGVTTLVISHDMASTFRIAHRINMLYGGQIIASGTPDEIRRHPDPYLREFISTSGAVEMLPPEPPPAGTPPPERDPATGETTVPRL
jgi:phospholipid/cholesterol/gamma-HCH transport system ATP-binding protein